MFKEQMTMEAGNYSAEKTETEVENRAAGDEHGEQHTSLLVNGKQIILRDQSKIKILLLLAFFKADVHLGWNLAFHDSNTSLSKGHPWV